MFLIFAFIFSYYPSVFILKPGQFVHINKGRLHAFRKLSYSILHEHDCHSELRNNLMQQKSKDKHMFVDCLCVSIAWDWTYRGLSSEAINREVSSMLECASLNRERVSRSLAIPETSLLCTANYFLARAKEASSLAHKGSLLSCSIYGYRPYLKDYSRSVSSEPIAVLRGILPSLAHLVARHKAAVSHVQQNAAKEAKNLQSPHPISPDSWENPQNCTIDPYGNDYFCKLCLDEISNVYMHCNGCEDILKKDFNICIR